MWLAVLEVRKIAAKELWEITMRIGEDGNNMEEKRVWRKEEFESRSREGL